LRKNRDPKVGTGKKPKGSGRRLYTDENPRDTVRIKFATPADASATVRKVKNINKRNVRKGLSGGVKFGPPPKKGPNPQGIKIMRSSNGKKRLRKSTRKK
jgi:hypothetical protein